jgi:hypothetical protein
MLWLDICGELVREAIASDVVSGTQITVTGGAAVAFD